MFWSDKEEPEIQEVMDQRRPSNVEAMYACGAGPPIMSTTRTVRRPVGGPDPCLEHAAVATSAG